MATYNVFCTKCGLSAESDSDLSLFPKDKSKPSGYRNQCKACRSIVASKWKHKNAEKNGLTRANSHLKRRYGITLDDYDKMLKLQDGKCAICGTSELAKGKSRFAVDHCHSTGKVRGLLCTNCNSGIGKLQDDKDLVMKAYEYLIRNGGN